MKLFFCITSAMVLLSAMLVVTLINVVIKAIDVVIALAERGLARPLVWLLNYSSNQDSQRFKNLSANLEKFLREMDLIH